MSQEIHFKNSILNFLFSFLKLKNMRESERESERERLRAHEGSFKRNGSVETFLDREPAAVPAQETFLFLASVATGSCPFSARADRQVLTIVYSASAPPPK